MALGKPDPRYTLSPRARSSFRLALRISPNVKLLPCVATKKDTVKTVLLELLYSILAEMEAG